MQQLVEFNIPTQTFIDIGSDTLARIPEPNSPMELGTGVFYSQLNHTLYTIDYDGQYIHVYDLRNLTFDTTQQPDPIPISVSNTACLASSNPSSPTLFVTGGTGSDANSIQNLQIWEANEWRDGPDMTYTRTGHGCIVVNDRLWVIAGYDRIDMEAISTSNIDDSSWESKGDLDPYLLYIRSVGVVAVDNLIYVIGGSRCCSSGSYVVDHDDTMYIINALNGDVTTISTGLLDQVYGRPVVAVDGIIYGFGGYSDSEAETISSWAVYNMLSDSVHPQSRDEIDD